MSEKEHVWTYQSSFKPWAYTMYPINAVQMRITCMPWVMPVSVQASPWVPRDQLSQEGTYPLLSPHSKSPTEGGKESVLKSVIFSSISNMKTVYEHEGFFGLYRGLTADVLHKALEDVSLYFTLYYCYPCTRRLCIRCTQMLSFAYEKTKSWISPPRKRDSLTVPVVYEEDEESNKLSSYEVPCTSGTLTPTIDIAHAVIKNCLECVCYPLLTVKQRMIVHEGPEIMSFIDTVRLSYEYDGIQKGLYGGFGLYIAVHVIEDSVDLLCLRLCRRQGYSWDDSVIIRSGVSTILSTLTAPFASLAIIQSVQSKIPGLCETRAKSFEILEDMPWTFLAFNFAVSTLLTTLNTIASVKSLQQAQIKRHSRKKNQKRRSAAA